MDEHIIILQKWRTADLYDKVLHRLIYNAKTNKITVEWYSKMSDAWFDSKKGCMETCWWGL